MVSGGQGAPFFQEMRPGASFKTSDFVKEKLGGATVERLDRSFVCLQIRFRERGCLKLPNSGTSEKRGAPLS